VRILVISKECASIDLAHKLAKEGHEVRFAVNEKGYKKVGMGFGLKRVSDWRKELVWVG
jgi:hypothetical protein